MALDPRLENYLSTLDQTLRPIPASERADIVLEIRSHVLSALEREPGAGLDGVLRALGEPELVANRYLLERGLRPAKPPISPIVKWIVIGVLGSGFFVVACIALLLWSLSPVFVSDSEKGRVTLLNGLIDIDDERGSVRFGTWTVGERSEKSFSGRLTTAPKSRAEFFFGNGRAKITSYTGAELSWFCRGDYGDHPPAPAVYNAVAKLDLRGLTKIDCEISVPDGTMFVAEGENGRLELDEPRFNFSAMLNNGRVSIRKDPKVRYAYDFRVHSGRAEHPPADPNPQYTLRALVENGRVSIDGK